MTDGFCPSDARRQLRLYQIVGSGQVYSLRLSVTFQAFQVKPVDQ
jgi:hypothetical protein